MTAPTIGDVARQAGVSPATVSRVLNNPAQVGAERRRRVERAISDLSFVPFTAAQTLKSGRSMTIGAIFPRLDSVLFGSVLNELQAHLDGAGYTLTTMTTGYDIAMEPQRVRQLIARGVDALVLIGSLHAPETDDVIAAYGLPRVNLWSWQDESPHVQIGFCNRSAAHEAAAHVCSLGHERIGVISGHAEGNDRAEMCLAGVRDALTQANLTIDPTLFVAAGFGVENGAAAFLSLMNRAAPPTAIVCTSDLFAFGALREARHLGLRVPRDISITGFDDSDFAQITTPELTTVRTPRQLMATRCAQTVLGHLTEGHKMSSLRLPSELVVRGSTARLQPA